MDRPTGPVKEAGEEISPLQSESEKLRTEKAGPDPYSFHGGSRGKGDGTEPRNDGKIEVKDPYDYHQGGKDSKLSPDAQKELQRKLEEYKANLEKSNFSIEFKKGEGPWNAITRQKQEAEAKKAKGEKLSPQEEAVLTVNPNDVLKEARRMRDRDFKELKDDKGNLRNWYKVGEKSERYTPADIDNMVKEAAKKFQAEAEAEQRKAEEAQKKLEAEEEARKQKELEEAQKQALAQAVDKSVPPVETMEKARQASGLQLTDMKGLRENIKAVIMHEILNNTLKPEDLNRPPRVGSVYLASGVIKPEEFAAAYKEQEELKKKATPENPAPRIGALLRKRLEASAEAERLSRFDQIDKFYDELLKQLQNPEKK